MDMVFGPHLEATSEKPIEQSYLNRFSNASKLLKLKYMAGQLEPEITQITEVDSKGKTLHLDQWHILPTYRLKLTLWYRDRLRGEPGKLKRKEKIFKEDYESHDSANAAALRLAKAFRGSGEWVMLVSRQEGEVDCLDRYAVGVWDWYKLFGTKVPCKWSLILDWERERLHSHKDGDLTTYVEVIRAWQTPTMSLRPSMALDGLQHADEYGAPPRGHPVLAPYRFGRYVMQIRNDGAWQSLIATTPLYPIRNQKGEVLTSGPSRICGRSTHDQLPVNAWLPQNIRCTIAGLESNINKLRLLEQQPRDLEARFVPEDTETGRQTPIEKPVEVDWHLSKRWVMAKDIAMLEGKVRVLENLKLSGCEAVSTCSVRALLQAHTTELLTSLFCSLVVVARRLSRIVARPEYRKPNSTPVSAQENQEKSMPRERCQDPNICKCPAHRWRRRVFPDHDPLPIVQKSTNFTNPEVYAETPRWVRDPTYKGRHFQHFIPGKDKYPEPTTFRGYIRRELETAQPIPRETYVKFGVMSEGDCINRWGVNWQSDAERNGKEWDEDRNVVNHIKKTKGEKQAERELDAYPWRELDGYQGCLREHEMPPPQKWNRTRSEVVPAIVMALVVCSFVGHLAMLGLADLAVVSGGRQ